MKMVFVVYNEALDEEVMEIMSANSLENYTKWHKVSGVGKTSGPHLMSHVWPKANNVLMTCVEDAQVEAVMAGVGRLREKAGTGGVKAFVLPIEAATL